MREKTILSYLPADAPKRLRLEREFVKRSII